MAQPTTVMLVFGGESSEHTVSISSARNVYAALDETKFEVILVYIDKTGCWWLIDSLDNLGDTTNSLQLTPVLGKGSFVTLPGGECVNPDVILPILHGENGEDGAMQGLAKLLHIPIVGCQIAASAICMDKALTKQLLEYNGIKTTPYEVHLNGEPNPDYDKLAQKLGRDLFVKPAGCGSSVGVSKVKQSSDLAPALSKAHDYDNKVLIEKAITARELEVAMLGGGRGSKASGVGEIEPDGEFYDFDSKYDASSQSKVVIPAKIPDEIAEKIRSIAKRAYGVVGGYGLARIDFFLSEDGTIYLNEINTMPGFTNISMYPKLWRKAGVSYSELIEKLIALALAGTK